MRSLRRSLRLFLVASGILLAGFLFNLVLTADGGPSPRQAVAGKNTGLLPEPGGIHATFTGVAAKVRPAVVFIRTERGRDDGTREQTFGPFDFFREMFPDERQHQRPGGGGSGFIIDKDGRILTNEHVIRDADKITVILGQDPDEEEYDAAVVGYDAHTDIAVIKIEADGELPVVELGDSDEMSVGDWVMAIGTPFGQLAGTVTVGVVSAKGRSNLRIMGGVADYQDFIQTDASINFGNSGGPLVNMRGEAIGINSAINPSGQGIGFAIPINMAKNISAQLIDQGKVQYGFMGIRLQELNKTLAEGLGLSVQRGILVTEIVPDSPAERAGLKKNDVIVEYRDEPVRDDQRFRLMVGNTKVGVRVPLKIVRKGRTKQVMIKLGERPQPGEIVASTAPRQQERWLGLQVDDVSSPDVRARFPRVDHRQGGVVVVEVKRGSPAHEAGILEGDVITEIYSQPVTNLKEYVAIAEKLKDRKEPIAFLVKRRRTSTYMPVIPEKD